MARRYQRLQIVAFCFCAAMGTAVAVTSMEQPGEASTTTAASQAANPRQIRAPKLFSEPPGGVLPVSAVVARNKPITGEIATTTVNGVQQPVVRTVSINKGLLLDGPKRLALDMPGGVNVVITRRADVDGGVPPQAPAAAAAASTNSSSAVSVWVGEVVGFRGPASSVVLVTAENGGVYGRITYVDRKGKQKKYTISPFIMEGADPAAAAAADAASTGDVDVASLRPNIDTTRHVVMEVIQPDYAKLHAEQIRRNGNWLATRKAEMEGRNVSDAALLVEAQSAFNVSANETTRAPLNAQSIAEALAASAGLGVSKDPADYLAVATAYTNAAAVPATTALRAADASTIVAPTADNTTPESGRKLLQGNIVVDVLMLYTSTAASRSGGEAAIQNNIRAAVGATNKAYLDSGVALQLNIVGIRQVSYTETGDANRVLDDLTYNRIPNVHQWRNDLGADMVQIWSLFQCGVAWPHSNGQGFMYSQVGDQCWDAPTLAHEFGHNQGCGHNVDGYGQGGGNLNSYAFGWRRCDLGSRNFLTIMSYPCTANGQPWAAQQMLFANPARTINGVAAGDAGRGHCARTLGETARTVAGFRQSVVNTGGTIRLGNLAPNKCLDAPSFAAGTRVHLWDCHSGNNQQWQLQADGSLRIPGTNTCLDVRQGGSADGTPIQVWDCNGTPAQLWFYDSLRRLHPYAAPHKCLDQAAGNTANGAQMQLWECQTGNNNQIWTTNVPNLTPSFALQNQGLRSALNGFVVDVSRVDFTNGNPIHMWNWLNANNQKWVLDSRGALRSTHNNNKCMDAAAAGNGAVVYIWDCHTGANQRWFMDRLGRLRPYHAINKCLDIHQANTAQGARVQLWDCVDVPQQKWSVI